MSEIKRGAGRPRVDATPVTVRLPPADLAALDAAIAREPEPITRPAMIRKLLAEKLGASER